MRVLLFLATNIAVLLLVSITFRLLGFESYFMQSGYDLDMQALLVWCALFGFGGSLISLALSKKMAKWSTRAQVIDNPTTQGER
jgi:heat shock protein HtpX|tara:strand:- start:1932 stop:2183 length:252 start_codon:yes stop_codon:yes gene_type:complete